jgi:ABC-type dipeptide/oligopeptide/nickel transport system permease subunit
MKSWLRFGAGGFLLVVILAVLLADWLAPGGYAAQNRDLPLAAPCERFLLGTDELGRDLFARVLFGGRVSLLLAGAAAAVSTVIAALAGLASGFAGGAGEALLERLSSLLLSLPWLFLLLAARASLPLDLSPVQSAWITFLMLGLLGWAAPAQVIARSTAALRQSGFALRARAQGCGWVRIAVFQMSPNLWPVIRSQFLILLPGFILTEATLSLLGLGVSEPLPSWGGLLRGLEDYTLAAARPWRLAPLALLVLVAASIQIVTGKGARSR